MPDIDPTDRSPTARRGFIGRLLAGAAALIASGPATRLLDAAPASGAAEPTTPAEDPDWMAALTAKHRTVFDVAAHRNGKPLAQAKNYLDGWRDAFRTPERDLNLVIGVHGEGLPLVLQDAVWSRYAIGGQYDVMDGSVKGAATRNVFSARHAASAGLVTSDQSVDALQQRGVRFLICRNTIGGATKKLVDAGLGSAEEIRSAITDGLLPGVIVVPAMVVALTQLQERGVRYIKIT